MTKIFPTVGRKVWYHPDATERLATIGDQPLDATIVGVWSDTCVNLAIHDANGQPHARTSVLLVNCEKSAEMAKTTGRYCEWMPYQLKSQAPDPRKSLLIDIPAGWPFSVASALPPAAPAPQPVHVSTFSSTCDDQRCVVCATLAPAAAAGLDKRGSS